MEDVMADGQAINPHLSGNLAPIRSEDDFDLAIEGRIPDNLHGAYYRNGPNPQFEPRGPYHAFIGDETAEEIVFADFAGAHVFGDLDGVLFDDFVSGFASGSGFDSLHHDGGGEKEGQVTHEPLNSPRN